MDEERETKKKQQQHKGERTKSLDKSSFRMCVFYCCSSIFIYILIYFIAHMQLVQYIHSQQIVLSFSIHCEAQKGISMNNAMTNRNTHSQLRHEWIECHKMTINDFLLSLDNFLSLCLKIAQWNSGDFHWWYGINMVSYGLRFSMWSGWWLKDGGFIMLNMKNEWTRQKREEKRMKHSIKSNNNNASIPFMCAIVRVCTTNRMVHFFCCLRIEC